MASAWTCLAGWLIAAAGGDIRASLKVAERPDESLAPYRAVELVLENATSAAVESVVLRPAGGGPQVRYRLAVAPGATGRLAAALPAISAVEDYAVIASDARGGTVAQAAASITWPAELLATDAFVDESFNPWRDEPASWPLATRRDVLLLLAGFVAATAGVLFVRRRLRVAGALCLAAVAALAAAKVLDAAGGVRVSPFHLVLHEPDVPARVESFTVLAAHRGSRLTLGTTALPYPVYPRRADAAGDDAVVDPARREITLTLRAGERRIIRPAPRSPPPSGGSLGGTVRERDREISIEADFPHGRAVIVRDDSFWPVEPGFGRLTATVRADQAQSVWNLTADPKRPQLQEQEVRLWRWWRDRFRRPGKTYLVNFPAGVDDCRLEVLRLRGADEHP